MIHNHNMTGLTDKQYFSVAAVVLIIQLILIANDTHPVQWLGPDRGGMEAKIASVVVSLISSIGWIFTLGAVFITAIVSFLAWVL